MHSTLAVSGEGLPLGVPHIHYEAPDGQAEQRKPLEERKTMRWIRGLRACGALEVELADPERREPAVRLHLVHVRGERIERAVTINAVIAWRLTAMTLLGRDPPELPAETQFS